MKKIILFTITVLAATVASADTGVSGISGAADGVVSYMPYVRALCYVIAAIIAIVGAVAVYYTMQTNPQNTAKRISLTVGSALTFVCLSLALPQFFGIDGSVSGGNSGSGTNGTAGTGTGFLASDQGGISRSGIITEIPSFADERWVHFPSGTKMETAHFLLDIYDKNGGGAPGSYGNTLDYINQLYRHREINYGIYNVLMSLSGNLPHN